jgi:hypothetical protein
LVSVELYGDDGDHRRREKRPRPRSESPSSRQNCRALIMETVTVMGRTVLPLFMGHFPILDQVPLDIISLILKDFLYFFTQN